VSDELNNDELATYWYQKGFEAGQEIGMDIGWDDGYESGFKRGTYLAKPHEYDKRLENMSGSIQYLERMLNTLADAAEAAVEAMIEVNNTGDTQLFSYAADRVIQPLVYAIEKARKK
jgi:flagellar biosynthesis/type III secretory pathway protein FliH